MLDAVFLNCRIILLSFLFLSCNNKKATSPPLANVKVVEVIQHDTPITKEFAGQVYGIKEIPIRARVDGFLDAVLFAQGSYVKKGKLLYMIDPEQLRAQVENQKSKVAESLIQKAKSQSDLNRYEPLAKINAVSQSDYDAILAQYEASLEAVKANQSELEIAEINLSYTSIHSPIDGLIGKTLAKVGEYVGKSPNPIILNKVVKVDTILVQFFISEQDYLALARKSINSASERKEEKKEESNLSLIFQDGTVFKHKGKFDFINNEVDPTTGTILIQASFPNPERLIRPGQFARVKSVIGLIRNANLIPERCVYQLQGKHFAYLLKPDNTVEQTEVDIIASKQGFYVVKSENIQLKDKVVYEGLQKIKNKDKVNPELIDLKPKFNLN